MLIETSIVVLINIKISKYESNRNKHQLKRINAQGLIRDELLAEIAIQWWRKSPANVMQIYIEYNVLVI